ncbi:uncharacterized protein N7500_008392 [Penicillium coprophilum]|uniref:uncharacterized protein n=1 Tax=Penicillium coprophilum TaxID=36646 RepID=UPI00238222FE|nr:uncharacterized protein N7500_008392 [Penicillium coprophilum]KAJ5158741.1 hypothetical protein N7500_008392 [Penicillium coprophilum]
MACVADTFRGYTYFILAAQSQISLAGRHSTQMELLLTSYPIIQTGRAANYRSCTFEAWVDLEPGRENGSACRKRMTSGLEKIPNLLLLGLGVQVAAASSFGEGVVCSRGYGYFSFRQVWN